MSRVGLLATVRGCSTRGPHTDSRRCVRIRRKALRSDTLCTSPGQTSVFFSFSLSLSLSFSSVESLLQIVTAQRVPSTHNLKKPRGKLSLSNRPIGITTVARGTRLSSGLHRDDQRTRLAIRRNEGGDSDAIGLYRQIAIDHPISPPDTRYQIRDTSPKTIFRHWTNCSECLGCQAAEQPARHQLLQRLSGAN